VIPTNQELSGRTLSAIGDQQTKKAGIAAGFSARFNPPF
jgi:hypothetical protein